MVRTDCNFVLVYDYFPFHLLEVMGFLAEILCLPFWNSLFISAESKISEDQRKRAEAAAWEMQQRETG